MVRMIQSFLEEEEREDYARLLGARIALYDERRRQRLAQADRPSTVGVRGGVAVE